MIEARILADSMAPSGVRLTTFLLKYPRFIHSEFMTHRMFSRNASSSRAIPFKRRIEEIEKELAAPIQFRANQKGMQGGAALEDQEAALRIWRAAAKDAIKQAEKLNKLGAHKQYVNRIIEPFTHITVVCTATDYANFFGLRYHTAAQPEIAELARQMYYLYITNSVRNLDTGEWHLPFITQEEESTAWEDGDYEDLLQMSVARCARVSYERHEGGTPTLEEDKKLYERLLGAQPIHASPAEHQAMAVADPNVRSGNFRGWIQHRKTLRGENIEKFDGPIGGFDDSQN